MNHITIIQAVDELKKSGKQFVSLFKHGTLLAEYYIPDKIDKQQPHTRDEIYVIATGTGMFYHEGERKPVGQGDFLFVAAGAIHFFESFSEDFATWVFFYGPEGGEAD